jgi:outer membrane protein assembly factor BamB
MKPLTAICFLCLAVPLTLADELFLYRGDAEATANFTADFSGAALKTAWQYPAGTGTFQAAPLVAGDTVYAGVSDDGFIAVDLQSGKLRWKFPLQTIFTAPAVYYKDKTGNADGNAGVFVGGTDGILHSLDAQNGKERWKFDLKGTIDNSPNVDVQTQRLLAASQEGTLYALEAATGKTVWQYKTGDQIRCFPTISKERRCFVAGCDSLLHIIDLDTGKGIAKVPLDAPTGSVPLVAGNAVYFGTEGNEFLAVDWKSAKVLWRFPVKQAVRAPAALAGHLVLFGGFDKTVYALEASTGKLVWQYKTKGRIEGGAVVIGKRVYVPSGDSTLYEFDWQSGKLLKSFPQSGKLLTSPSVSADGISLTTGENLIQLK